MKYKIYMYNMIFIHIQMHKCQHTTKNGEQCQYDIPIKNIYCDIHKNNFLEMDMYGCIANVGHIQCMCHWCNIYGHYYDKIKNDILSYRYADLIPSKNEINEFSEDTMTCAMCIICKTIDAKMLIDLCNKNKHIIEIQNENENWSIAYIKTDMIIPDVCIKYFPSIYNIKLVQKENLDMCECIDKCVFEHFTARLSLINDAFHIDKKNSRFCVWNQIISEISMSKYIF